MKRDLICCDFIYLLNGWKPTRDGFQSLSCEFVRFVNCFSVLSKLVIYLIWEGAAALMFGH